jgi:DNA repair exonuclease SbcCD ATPase subunit
MNSLVTLPTSSHTTFNSCYANTISKLPIFDHLNAKETLALALRIVQGSDLHLQEHLDQQSLRSPDRSHPLNVRTNMRRNQHHLEEREEQSSPSRQYPGAHYGYPGFAHPSTISEDPRRLPYHGEMGSVASSPYQTVSSPGSSFMPPQSPMQAPQPMRSTILPSPSSLNYPNTSTLPSISSPSTVGQTSAQSAHLQDLQHQISVKTLAFQTLQREYDSLLQKLERQRTKCATLEKKFEVSDVEINSLTDEKERLYLQVAALEGQVEGLQQSRDEARCRLIENGTQYMRIMEMANRLQGQSAEDKKKWETEKTEMEQRIRLLEEAMVTGTAQLPSQAENPSHASPGENSLVHPHGSATPNASQSETINVLRAEVGRLRSRTQTLETALQTMRRESISIQTAARQLVESSGKLEDVAQETLGTGG